MAILEVCVMVECDECGQDLQADLGERLDVYTLETVLRNQGWEKDYCDKWKCDECVATREAEIEAEEAEREKSLREEFKPKRKRVKK